MTSSSVDALRKLAHMTPTHDPGNEPASPGVAPPSTGSSVEFTRLVVDGETFAVSIRDEDGSTDYDWLSGPNEGYGFSTSQGGRVPTREEHIAAIRGFLAGINPETGYL